MFPQTHPLVLRVSVASNGWYPSSSNRTMWLSFRESLATTGVLPTGLLLTVTRAFVGLLDRPTSWFVPCMIVAHAAASGSSSIAVFRIVGPLRQKDCVTRRDIACGLSQ